MSAFRSVLIADDEASIRHVLTLVLSAQGYEVRTVADGEEALKELGTHQYDVLISDVRMPKVDGMALLKSALAQWPDLTCLVMSAYGSKDQALEAVAAGAYDFIQKPFKPEEVVFILKKAEERLRLVRENRRLKAKDVASAPLDRMLGSSEPMASLRRQIQRVAPVSSTVLITGESGTGKELVARAIHELSPRVAMPFVTVNCGAIPAGLIESELFGHAKGAFTDARQAKRGLFSDADGGTLFLDEIGELPMPAQVKLLRFLQEGEIRPVGDNRIEKADVRVVAATLRELGKLVEKGEFREDLYFRLHVVNLDVPPLRDRRDDVMRLAAAFLARFNHDFNRDPPIAGFSPEAEALMVAYAWPGNVRELENAVERAVILTDGSRIEPEDLPEEISAAPPPPSPSGDLRPLAEVERDHILAVLEASGGNKARAAERLGIGTATLFRKLKEYNAG